MNYTTLFYVFTFLFNSIACFSLHDFKSIQRAMLEAPFPSNNGRIVIRQSGPGFESVQIKEISPSSSSEDNIDIDFPRLVDPSPLIGGRLFNMRPKMVVISKHHLKGSRMPRSIFDSLGEENDESKKEESENKNKGINDWKKVGSVFSKIIKDFFSFDKPKKDNSTESMKIKIIDNSQKYDTNSTNNTNITENENNSNVSNSTNSTTNEKIKIENKIQIPQVGVNMTSHSIDSINEKKSNTCIFILFSIVIFFIIILIVRYFLSKDHQTEDSNIFSINSNDDEVRRAKLNKLK